MSSEAMGVIPLDYSLQVWKKPERDLYRPNLTN